MNRLVCIVLLLSLGCRSAGPRTNKNLENLRPVREIPTEYQEILVAYGTGGEVWEQHRERVRKDERQTRFLVENLVREMLRAYQTGQLAFAKGQIGAFERAQGELVELGPDSVPVLAQILVVCANPHVHPVAETLRLIGESSLPAVRELLSDEDPEGRRRAAELLGSLPYGREQEPATVALLAQRLTSDEDWSMRAQCARSLGLRVPYLRETRPVREVLELALDDGEPTVAEQSALSLALLSDPAAVPALIVYLDRAMLLNGVTGVRAAQAALMTLTGVNAQQDPRGWRATWRELRSRSGG